MEDLTGRQFGPYHIVEPLGEGGMAAVFKAYQANMDRHVAIKVLPRQLASDPQFVGRFKQEALVLAKLQHPHILPVFDFGESEGYTYLVTPLIESGTLKDLLRGEPLPLEQIRNLVSQVGDALDYAHSHGLVHRDVKPSNVLTDERGNCLLTDFGIAKIVEGTSKFTSTGGTVGTPAYMSPEQGRGDKVDTRTDVYTLGVMLYEMATGRVPFEAETPVAVIFKHIQEPLPPPRTLNPDLPKIVERVIFKALTKDPQDRYATAGEMVQALRAAIPVDAMPTEGLAKIATGRDDVPAPARGMSVVASARKMVGAIKRATLSSKALLWLLGAASAAGTIISIALALTYSSKYGFLQVPFASWFVFVLSALILALNGTVFYLWRRFRTTSQELAGLRKQPLEDEIPAVCGHERLHKAEFLVIVQSLFRRPPGIKYVHVKLLPGGYGGSTTVLAELQREQSAPPLPRPFVIKLGHRREMADEHDKFQDYVLPNLPRTPSFFRHAECGDFAGIAYEFAGLDRDNEIQSFHQFYKGYAAIEVSELIGEIYTHLDEAWYQNGGRDRVNLYHEYGLLSKKQERTIGHVGEIVDEDDPYRVNFTVIEGRLQPNLKPNFCLELGIPWHDPVAFLRTWPRQNLTVPVCRSTVHGDLHARNVLVEIGREGQKRVWFIDFSHTGNGLSGDRTREAIQGGVPTTPDRGHTLRDFCRLEADVKFILTRLQDEDDLELAVAFERELMAGGLALNDRPVTPPPFGALREERFRKAWQVIGEIRRRAAAYLINADDLRPYYLSLLHATLPIVYYHRDQFESEACERQQKRYALISAGMLCRQL